MSGPPKGLREPRRGGTLPPGGGGGWGGACGAMMVAWPALGRAVFLCGVHGARAPAAWGFEPAGQGTGSKRSRGRGGAWEGVAPRRSFGGIGRHGVLPTRTMACRFERSGLDAQGRRGAAWDAPTAPRASGWDRAGHAWSTSPHPCAPSLRGLAKSPVWARLGHAGTHGHAAREAGGGLSRATCSGRGRPCGRAAAVRAWCQWIGLDPRLHGPSESRVTLL